VDYLQEDCYKDISSSVTVNAAISVLNKEIRKYTDGTIVVSVSGTIAGNISAATALLSGLPLGAFEAYVPVELLQYGTTTPYIRNKCLFYSSTTGEVVNEATVTLGSDNTVSINFEYRVK
jgi:hypothetical protein